MTDICVQDFLVHLAKRLPKIKQSMNGIDIDDILKRKLFFVINGEPCTDKSRIIRDRDEVQVLTPVTGG